jgi:hypothetical protein
VPRDVFRPIFHFQRSSTDNFTSSFGEEDRHGQNPRIENARVRSADNLLHELPNFYEVHQYKLYIKTKRCQEAQYVLTVVNDRRSLRSCFCDRENEATLLFLAGHSASGRRVCKPTFRNAIVFLGSPEAKGPFLCCSHNTILQLTMEVASPLQFVPNNTGTKRHLPCSPSFVDSNRGHFAMDSSSDEFVQHRSFKRRRFNMDVSMDGDSENSVNHASFPMHHTQQQKSPFASSNGEFRHCRF